MKTQLSSFDIAAMVREMRQCVGLRVEKVFLQGYDDLYIRMTDINVKKTFSIKVGQFMWLQEGFRKSESIEPPQFAMLLRKYMSGKQVKSIRQHGFDRVVIFELEGNIRLIAEMFGSGNVILVEDRKIIQPLTSKSWRARDIKAGKEYRFPPDSANPLAFSLEHLGGIIKGSKKDLVRCLAMELNLGGAHAEEVCHVIGRSKNDKAFQLDDEEIGEVHETIQSFLEMLDSPSPRIIYDYDGKQIDLLPFELSMYEKFDAREFETFSLAVKEYFGNLPEKKEDKPRESGRRQQLERQLASQMEAVEQLEIKAADFQEKGDWIYAHYQELDALLGKVGRYLSGGNWQAEKESIEELENVKDFNPSSGILTVTSDEWPDLGLDVRMDLNENAARHYERSKKARAKLEGAETAIKETKKLLEVAEKSEGEKKESQDKKPTRRFWFDRFRWFRSSQGHMVVAGRDARSNDQVVKKHLKDSDLYAHADMSGAPSVVIKDVTTEDEETLHEACIFAISFSKAWKASIGSGSAYWVKPDQVSKTPQPGEFLARGAFIIRGKRNYSNKVDLRLAISKVEIQGAKKVMCGPEAALKALTDDYHVIVPGEQSPTELSKKLSDEYNVPIEEIDRVLPPGKITVVR